MAAQSQPEQQYQAEELQPEGGDNQQEGECHLVHFLGSQNNADQVKSSGSASRLDRSQSGLAEVSDRNIGR